MKQKIVPVIIILLLIGAVGAGYWYFSQNPDQLTQLQLKLGFISEAEAFGVYTVSGFIETDEIGAATETRGRITQITVDEGDFVEVGQTLIELDTALLTTEIQQAKAKIKLAEAQLAKVEAGVRSEEIARAEATVAVAEANAQAAYTLWQDALTLRDNPQELDMQIDAAKTALELAELKITYATPFKDAAEAMWEMWYWEWYDIQQGLTVRVKDPQTGDVYKRHFDYPEGVEQQVSMQWNLAGADQWEAWVDLNSAVSERNNTEMILNDLLRLRNDPQESQIKVAETEAAYQAALAEVEVAKAQLKILEAGPRSEQIALAEAQVKQAEAILAALNVERDKHTVKAPLAGWVVEKTAHEGEMAVPGVTLLTLADLSNVTLTIYIPAADVDTVSLGQEVEVFVDTFPGKPFVGHVTFISDEAEFTPKNVQTKEERVNTVFAVKIKLDNQDRYLKSGMPADVILSDGQPEL